MNPGADEDGPHPQKPSRDDVLVDAVSDHDTGLGIYSDFPDDRLIIPRIGFGERKIVLRDIVREISNKVISFKKRQDLTSVLAGDSRRGI